LMISVLAVLLPMVGTAEALGGEAGDYWYEISLEAVTQDTGTSKPLGWGVNYSPPKVMTYKKYIY